MSLERQRSVTCSEDFPRTISSAKAFHLPGLNQLRFLAAAAVMVHHLELVKLSLGLDNLATANSWVQIIGREGVRLFFVLSGFLITMLLVKEIDKTGKINVASFYVRRVLRIWPLYFLTVFLAFFVGPCLYAFPTNSTPGLFALQGSLFDEFSVKLLLYFCFLPNYCLVKFPPIIAGSHCWSLGVEEQFYLFCPLLLFVFRRNIILGLSMALALKHLVLYVIVYVLTHTVLRHSVQSVHEGNLIYETIWKVDVESFVAGGLAAYMFVRKPQFVERLTAFKPISFVVAGCIIFSCTCEFTNRIPVITLAFVFAILLMSKYSGISGFAGRTFDYLGRISYGLYMFHPIVMYLALPFLLSQIGAQSVLIFSLSAYLVVFGLTILLSALSYKHFESPFLRLKRKYSTVRSVD